jgi:hypothetical protein
MLAALHVPLPLQFRSGVSMLPEQPGAAHCVDEDQSSQAPPLHLPSSPQLDIEVLVHTPRGSGISFVAALHVPFMATCCFPPPHAWQALVQAMLQQKPSTQNPLAQWAATVQAPPCEISGTQLPPLQ